MFGLLCDFIKFEWLNSGQVIFQRLLRSMELLYYSTVLCVINIIVVISTFPYDDVTDKFVCRCVSVLCVMCATAVFVYQILNDLCQLVGFKFHVYKIYATTKWKIRLFSSSSSLACLFVFILKI